MATIQSMSVALDADISGFRRGLRRADRRLHEFRGSASDTLTRMRGTFATRGRSLGSALASNMAGALRGAGSMMSSALQGMAKKPVVLGAAIAAGAVLGGALVNAFTIALGGLAVVGISYYILKDRPKIKAALYETKKDIKGTFKDAAEPMMEPLAQAIRDIGMIIKKLKPEFEEMFQTVADSKILKNLTGGLDGFLKGFMPGFNDMLKDMKPVFEGLEYFMTKVGEGLGGFFRELGKSAPEAKIALEDLGDALKTALIWAGKIVGFLTKVYAKAVGVKQALGAVWDMITEKLGVFWEKTKATFGKIVDYIKGFPGRVLGALGRYVSDTKKKFTEAKNNAVSRVKSFIKTAVDKIAGFPLKAYNALKNLGSKLKDRALSAGRKLVDGIKDKIGDAVDKVRDFPGRAKRALGNLGSRLYNSGRSLIGGFISGIWSKIGDVANAAASVVSRARDFFPFSPAKEGPFSGRGYTTFSGAALIDGFRQGIAGGLPGLRSEIDAMYGTVPNMRANVSGVVRAGRKQEVVHVLRVEGSNDDVVRMVQKWVRTDGRGRVESLAGK